MNEREVLLPRARLQPPQVIDVRDRDLKIAQARIRGNDLDLRDPAVRKALARLILEQG